MNSYKAKHPAPVNTTININFNRAEIFKGKIKYEPKYKKMI